MKIQDTETNLWLTFNDNGSQTWVSSENDANIFTDQEAEILLDQLNEGGSERFVGRPGDRAGL